ncbi:PREDICTED: LOW QUALITY PROTEIN: G-protein coupled receptor family C group 6 member A-like [Cyprinodon variegatus]|uniref:LOW QUALITY PROTEIN: G-protein coupled receptor family C group 6 member A-like n=1 Tax=Cyprinodon variegatus TaxID=28743 RepID=UPI0007429D26|nr:PREDICTED: LOW QUALITY PROTEIN: G-protein coupled receptor family C group 6 member A-like [Cyprinodon variegatus]
MKPLLIFLQLFAALSLQILCNEALQEAKSTGDIIIGGLFPIHESVNDKGECDRFSDSRLAQSLIMIHAIEEINQSGELGNITLGYHIVDSCADVTTALKNSLLFMKMNPNSDTDCKHQPPPPVMAVIGDYYSEISIAVTRHLNLEQIPQISYGSTSGRLSDKTRFPSFLRTVPKDDHQAHAIIEILKNRNWNWVGVIATDGEYGRYAVERLRHHAKKNNICFAYVNFLPEFLVDENLEDSIKETVQNITENGDVSVIVSFAKSKHMEDLFNSVLKDKRGRNKVWVASDNWSQSAESLDTEKWTLEDVGTVFGITLKSGKTSKFEQFLRNLDLDPDLYKNNSFLRDFLDKTENPINRLIKRTSPYAVFSIKLAVNAISQTIKSLCINKECNTSTLQPREFRDALKNSKFSLDGENYSFNTDCEVDSGYDVILWKSASKQDLNLNNIVGYYDIAKKSLAFNSGFSSLYEQIEGVTSKCSTCNPGEMKITTNKAFPVCCYECKKCPKNEYSNTTDATQCNKCDEDSEYSSEGSSYCTKRKDLYLKWEDPYHIAVLTATALGAVLTIIAAIIFIAYWNTPVVRSSGGPVSIILLFSLLFTFGSVTLFGAKPTKWKCEARQVWFGLSFTLSVSCILVKSFKIILAFEFDPVTKDVLKKLYKPYLIIAFCMGGQVLICVLWLARKAPTTHSEAFEKDDIQHNTKTYYILKKCKEEYGAFGVMLAYIGILAINCFALAFKGRNLPDCYNDAKFITFSMLIYFIAWIIFGPVYTNVNNEYHPAVEMVVIVISALGILFCQFLVKCYIILFKQNENTEEAFLRQIRKFSQSKGEDIEGNHHDGIQNPGFSRESLSSSESFQPISDQSLSPKTFINPAPVSPALVSETQPAETTNVLNCRKMPLQRYLSLPTWAQK